MVLLLLKIALLTSGGVPKLEQMVIDAKNEWKIFVISGASALSAILICEKLKCFFLSK